MSSVTDSSWYSSFVLLTLAAAVITLLAFLYIHFFYVDIPTIKGIPEIPGADPLAGHLYQLGSDHATTLERWSLGYRWPVFQIRMGRRRAVVLNSFESTRDWIVKNQSATLDRPWFYTFHGVVSATSAATIGTSPWNERTKKQRRIVGSLTTGPSIQKLGRMLDLETCAMVSGLYYDSRKGAKDIMPHIYQKRVALNVMTMFCYFTRFASVNDPLLLQILSDASTIASFRSTNSNPQDFIPHLRYFPGNNRTSTAVEVRSRRDRWLAAMLDSVRGNIKAERTERKSVAELLLADDNKEGLTTLDIKTILGGLMSGGFETLFSTAIVTIGLLSSREGQTIQSQAYDDILGAYETPEQAFELCLKEEKSAYVVGLVKEALRFYPPLKLLPARQTFKEFEYNGSIIPKGVLIYINAQAANRDQATYGKDADQFRPGRWIDNTQVPPPYHFAFGAGARMCTAVNFSNRVLYAMFVRLIVSFKISEGQIMPADTHYIRYKADPTASNAIPSDFNIHLKVRDKKVLERCFERSQENVGDLVSGEAGETFRRE